MLIVSSATLFSAANSAPASDVTFCFSGSHDIFHMVWLIKDGDILLNTDGGFVSIFVSPGKTFVRQFERKCL